MQIISNDNIEQKIAILGNFDGIHLGHQRLFNEAIKRAKEKGYKTMIYTFYEYPAKVDNRITTLSEKIDFFSELPIDYLYLDEFYEIKDLTPVEFLENILIEKLNVVEIFCGFNYTFGVNKSGTVDTLKEIIANELNNKITVSVIDSVKDSEDKVISSTRIREYIMNTDLQKAKELLGHNPIILGEVIHGKKIGRTLGFPTANLKFENKVYPSYGAYGVYVHIFGDPNIYHGVMNIGTNPTLKPGELSVEVHILDFNKDIYGETIKIEILEKISDEIKFTTVEDLIEKINNDVKLWRKRIDEKYGNTN
jgi:riboflavin kinase/FMN adenylyltransferase